MRFLFLRIGDICPLVQFEFFLTLKHIFRFSPQDVIKVDAVLGMITPIGVQMEYDRERVSAFYFRTLLRSCDARDE